MRHLLPSLTVAFIIAAASKTTAQANAPAPSADQLQRAGALFNQGDWAGANVAYDSLSKAYPRHALSRFRYGVTLMELGRLQQAEAPLREGEALGMPASTAAFRLAQLFGLQKRGDSSIAELKRAAANQLFVGQAAVQSDAHFAAVTSHSRWQEALDALDAVVRPCMHDSRFREFDFWLGDWDVRPVALGGTTFPGRNTVTLNYNGCVVIEHWKSGASEGESYNLFDRSTGEWRQTWVDNIGGQHDYHGKLIGKDMVYTGTTPAAGGALGRVPTRLTFFHISRDSVRQFSETSPDSGKTWRVAYDLLYVRRKAVKDSTTH